MLTETPAFMRDNSAPRPDGISTNIEQLFGVVRQEEPDAGLYVSLRDGQLATLRDGRTRDIGRGESAFVDTAGRTLARLDAAPSFILSEPTPRPDRIDARGVQLINTQSLGLRSALNRRRKFPTSASCSQSSARYRSSARHWPTPSTRPGEVLTGSSCRWRWVASF